MSNSLAAGPTSLFGAPAAATAIAGQSAITDGGGGAATPGNSTTQQQKGVSYEACAP